MAVAIGGSELALAAPLIGKTGSTRGLLVSLAHPTSFALERLERLRPRPSSTALAHALAVLEVLSAEPAGQRFFTEFRITLERMAASCDRRRSLVDRRMVALLALTRMLFLYFIQTKGWLAGRTDYMRGLLDRALGDGRPFHRTSLDPLFFGTLNRPMTRRADGVREPGIPYLNGGLFETHPVEQRIGPVHFANDLWRDAFERLFDRFTFCVRESDTVDAIAPDMLGRVFERLMDPDERANSGTFYTPESVVRTIVDTTLRIALDGMGERSKALRRIRVLDPAVGSGAFLLAALESLSTAAMTVDGSRSPPHPHALRRRILKENLFGVDVNPMAVRLAELRLWLAVVVDDPTTDISKIAPLPNLDGVVRQGNTLLDPLSTARLATHQSGARRTRAIRAVQAARRQVFEAHGDAGHAAVASLHDAERELATISLQRAIQVESARLQELRSAALARDLFGKQAGLSPRQWSTYRAIKHNRSALASALRSVRDGSAPFFSFEVHAPDVMTRGGFHAVLGNPPWVRAERLAPDERQVLRTRYSWWRASGDRGYAHLPDLAVAFLERALELTAPNGVIGFLMPSKVASSGYGRIMRQHLVRETTITNLYRVSPTEANRFGATTYPLAIVVQKAAPPRTHAVDIGASEGETVSQCSLNGDGPWVLVPDRARQALHELTASGTPLSTIARPSLGVKTGADSVFVGTVISESACGVRVQFGAAETCVEPEMLRPALRGRDLRRFGADPQRCIVWGYGHHGEVRAAIPPRTRQHVEAHRTRLEQRSDYGRGPLWTLFRIKATMAPFRLVWPDIARRALAVVLETAGAASAIPLNTCYVAPFTERQPALSAAAVFNSTWATVLMATTADEARGGYRRLNARVASAIPVPSTNNKQRALATLSAKAHHGNHVSQSDLDEAVADALDLSGSVRECLRSLADHHG
jgi:hypothetical protein